MKNALHRPPRQNELEVTVFGPGLGESVLVHCGNGEWICCDTTLRGHSCWPLWYIDQIGVQASSIRLIIATHWHSDHVKGLSQLLDVCTQAQFVCSAALRADEFKQIVARFSASQPGASRPPLAEVKKAFALLAARKGAAPHLYRPPVFASVHAILDRWQSGSQTVQIMALSPSPQDVLNAKEAFAGYFVPLSQPATGLSPIDQNHSSVVISVQIDQELLLLGADLEQTASQLTGWNAIVASTIRPQQPAMLFKVPHHGSENAQSDDVWMRMLISAAEAVVTAYFSSGLPRPEGIQWLKSKTANLYTTGLPASSRIRRRKEVDRTIRETTRRFSAVAVPPDPGTVRFRKTIGAAGPWNVETFGQAKRL